MKKIIHLFLLLLVTVSFTTAQVKKEIWGTTNRGGSHGAGVIFKTDSAANNYSIQHTFIFPEGRVTSRFTKGPDGKLYGIASFGGEHGQGAIFQYDPSNGTYQKKYDFEGGINGGFDIYPEDYGNALLLASNGKFYGLTPMGGFWDKGVVFQYDPATDSYLKLRSFTGNNGGRPRGSLIQAKDGNLYGLAPEGDGVLFQFNLTDTLIIKKYDFNYSTGSYPIGELVETSDGKLYGMTGSGGINGKGVIFQYDPGSSTYTKKIDFDGTNGQNGDYYSAFNSMVQLSDGKLYGMTSLGGTKSKGVLFQYDPATNTYLKKHDFTGADGSKPRGTLLSASDGKLYGLTNEGGAKNKGVLFQFDPATSSYNTKYEFNNQLNGMFPIGTLLQASDGKLYGTALGGISALCGVIFQYDPNSSTFTKKYDFKTNADGFFSSGSLVQGPNGQLWGTTLFGGGEEKLGVIFQLDPVKDAYSPKKDFTYNTDNVIYAPDGLLPGHLIKASDGKLYGTQEQGGSSNFGTLFQYDPTTLVYTKKYDFDSINGRPKSLMQAADGKLYGLTRGEGGTDRGVLFQFDPVTGNYNKKYDFQDTNGSYPAGALMQATDDKLYGLCSNGGTKNRGVLFQFDPATGNYSKKYDFDGTNGGYPNNSGALVQASDGKLYGMTVSGGTKDKGVLFQFDPLNSVYTKKLDFDSINGSDPYGSLLKASNGILYGMTSSGGAYNKGVLFQYDPIGSVYTKKLDFDGNNGASPYDNLIEVSIIPTGVHELTTNESVSIYPNPFSSSTTLYFETPQKNSMVRILNLLGEEVEHYLFSGKQLLINREDLHNGIYLLQIINEEGEMVVKKVRVE